MDWLIKCPIAHRGLHDGNKKVPENSYKAFELAIKNNHPIEMDIRFTKDESVIVFHDKNFKRLTGVDKNHLEIEKNDLKSMRLINTNEKIPVFNEFLEFVNGRVPILIEIKSQKNFGKFLKKTLSALKHYKGEFAIQSFNPMMLSWFKKNAPHIKRGQLSGSFSKDDFPFYEKFFLRNLLLNFKSKPDFIAYEIRELPTLMTTYYRKKGMPLIGWAAKTHEDLLKAKKYCDNIIFERIDPKIFLN